MLNLNLMIMNAHAQNINANVRNIFVVEDDPVYALALKHWFSNNLKSDSYKFQYFNSAEKCLNHLSHGEVPELIITDYYLEDYYTPILQGLKNGVDLAKEVRKYNKNLNVIILTNEKNLNVSKIEKDNITVVTKSSLSNEKIKQYIKNKFGSMDGANAMS